MFGRNQSIRNLLIGAAIICAGGCTSMSLDEIPVSDNGAVRALVAQADSDVAAGRVVSAGAALERALRIESRNPRLWLRLAELRMAQGDPEQAENTATRALSFAGREKRIRARAWSLIGEARLARGDSAGAADAERHRREFEP